MISTSVLLLSMSLLILSSYANSSPVNIITTIKPLALIAHDIVGKNANITILLPENTSPHGYALKPSDIVKIKTADLVVWVGPELELFLDKILKSQANALQLTGYKDMPLKHFHKHESDDHGSHHHASVDGHIWLGPKQSKVIAQAIAESMSRIDPSNEDDYQRNYQQFIVDVSRSEKDISSALSANPSKGYFLFHDAYSYFEDAFDLKPVGYFTVNTEIKPGMKTLLSIRKSLQNKEAQCIFTEPQFNPSFIESVSNGTGIKLIEIDPMAKDLNIQINSYHDFLMSLGKSYAECFRP
ncbi:zinc ABC transporter substrate-binding protein ZnuA [Candidatus Enterovibrio escicola]|uniref:zinc ABC transporter substrate-binding protein ZnuA n=1 Tax=Candidatus Enterovibrio escicola TaxID=1927127 RepID=UPI0012382276|nr:zinc ABC transporter substrate-binding protein ZnuA [Candidatus Enterovibrio escacola]